MEMTFKQYCNEFIKNSKYGKKYTNDETLWKNICKQNEINCHKLQIKDIRSRYYIKLNKSKVKYKEQKQFKKNNLYI
jgi:hypothetical protein